MEALVVILAIHTDHFKPLNLALSCKNIGDGYPDTTRGYTVRFSTLPAALTDLLQKESLPAFERCMKYHYLDPSC
jgi:hypothetical protein